MELLSFIKTCIHDPASLAAQSILCFRGPKEYPLLFFTQFLAWTKRIKSIVLVLDLERDDADDRLRAQLQTSFLGECGFYWLGNLSNLSEKRFKLWVPFIQQYSGPHCLAFYVHEDAKLTLAADVPSVVVPNKVMWPSFELLLGLESDLPKGTIAACRRLCGAYPEALPLDSMYVLLRYAILLGERQQEFTQQWLDQIMVNEQSLFTLSQYFFARNPASFFTYWRKIGGEYPEVFWVAYWSDQVWRAFLYSSLMRERRAVEAKKLGFRLPFSFLNTDWRAWTPEDLKKAHEQLYSLDYSLKNGGSSSGIDLFYSLFLTKK